jgi:DNA-binding response OmpR family regulator
MILIIDDEPTILELCKRMLECSGYSVLTASSGLVGIQLFSQQEVDLVILDRTMPDMDGPSTFSALRHVRPDVPVIISSGCHRDEAWEGFAEQGPNDYLQKPYRLQVLLEAIRQQLSVRAPLAT